ncbi:hypothetical protein X772_09695 [Mesorhizobium sp. LSJC280B00]|nr:hypothetical protein X772_09695 [Mesorhizobium sp. LSJC280B00]
MTEAGFAGFFAFAPRKVISGTFRAHSVQNVTKNQRVCAYRENGRLVFANGFA